MTHTTFAVPAGIAQVTIPSKPDGTSYQFALVAGEQGRAADTFTDLLGLVIVGYEDLGVDSDGDDEATIQRFLAARNFAQVLQDNYNAQADVNDALAECSPAEIDELFAPKYEPFCGTYTGSDQWDASVPMVCVEGDYAPWTDVARPEGGIVWISHVEEGQFVRSLAELGIVQLLVVSAPADDGGGDNAE